MVLKWLVIVWEIQRSDRKRSRRVETPSTAPLTTLKIVWIKGIRTDVSKNGSACGGEWIDRSSGHTAAIWVPVSATRGCMRWSLTMNDRNPGVQMESSGPSNASYVRAASNDAQSTALSSALRAQRPSRPSTSNSSTSAVVTNADA